MIASSRISLALLSGCSKSTTYRSILFLSSSCISSSLEVFDIPFDWGLISTKWSMLCQMKLLYCG